MNTKTWRNMLLRVGELFLENRRYLCELDGHIGDGDHGVTIARIGECIKARVLTSEDGDSIKKINDDLSMRLMNVNGGSAGPLYGTIFEGMADGIEEKEELTTDELKAMFRNAKEEFMLISTADIGNKTMVDALYPALDAIEECTGTEEEMFQAAAEAAEQGSMDTKDMVAKFGRAKNFGEKSLGFIDPGAASMALMFRGMAEGLN